MLKILKFFFFSILFLCVQIISFLLFLNSSFNVIIITNFYYINMNINSHFNWFTYFILLITFFILFVLSKKIVSHDKSFLLYITYMFIIMAVIVIILINDFIFFMIAFESLFFPICICSLFFNFNNRFIFAIYFLIIFSSISSVLCIIACIIIISHFNLLNLEFFGEFCFFDSIELIIFTWILLFLMFSIKYPIWPLHIWLPEVHVEVNTEMSALLASVVLKIGFFGVYKFLFLNFNVIAKWFLGFIDAIVICGLSFLAITILFLCDYKKIIAHWSVIHTGIGLILLWHNDYIFIGLLFFCNIGHIISSGMLFILIGYMYDNYGLRIFLLLVSFFGISIWTSLFIALFLFNIDFPFMLLFFIDLFVLYGLISLSLIYILNFAIIILIIFTSSIYIYMLLSFFSFIWVDKFLRLDLTINDIFFFFILAVITIILFFLIYIQF